MSWQAASRSCRVVKGVVECPSRPPSDRFKAHPTRPAKRATQEAGAKAASTGTGMACHPCEIAPKALNARGLDSPGSDAVRGGGEQLACAQGRNERPSDDSSCCVRRLGKRARWKSRAERAEAGRTAGRAEPRRDAFTADAHLARPPFASPSYSRWPPRTRCHLALTFRPPCRPTCRLSPDRRSSRSPSRREPASSQVPTAATRAAFTARGTAAAASSFARAMLSGEPVSRVSCVRRLARPRRELPSSRRSAEAD